jgi:HSP20 family protein
MSRMTTTTPRGNGNRYQDPFTLARSIFGFDPFYDVQRVSKTSFNPPFEVKEREDAFVLQADVAGVKESDLDISVNGNVLTVSGSRQADERKEGETYYLYERNYGSFSRSFTLPDEANLESIEAKLNDGVLNLVIGKKAQSRPRKIAVAK